MEVMKNVVPSSYGSSDDEEEDLFVEVHMCGRCKAKFDTRNKLQNLIRRKHLKKGRRTMGNLRVAVPVLRFFDLEVITPSKGVRQVMYTMEKDEEIKRKDEEIKRNDEKIKRLDSLLRGVGTVDSGSGINSKKYEDWRNVTFPALPLKVTILDSSSYPQDATPHQSPPPPPPPQRSPFSTEDKRLHLILPSDHFHMFNVDGVTGDAQHILHLITGQKTFNNVLDAYLMRRLGRFNNEVNPYLRSASKLGPISTTKYYYLSVLFLCVEVKDNEISSMRHHVNLLPKEALDEHSVLIAPLSICNHFYLAVFNCHEKSIYVYDSSWTFKSVTGEMRLDQVLALLCALFPECHHCWTVYFEVDCAQQIDNYSCACYVIYYVENQLKGERHQSNWHLNEAEIKTMRMEIAVDLLQTTMTGKQFLEAISE